MVDTREFRLWLAIQTGRLAVVEAEAQRLAIPEEELKVEVRRGGRWVVARPGELS